MEERLTLDEIVEKTAELAGFEQRFVRTTIRSFFQVLPELILSGKSLHIYGFCDLGLETTVRGNKRLRIKPARKILKRIQNINASINN